MTFQNEDHLAVVNIPVNDCGRFVMIKDTEEIHHITYLDEIIRHEMHHLFSEDEITGIFEIKLSRDAELYIDDIYSGVLAEKIYESLKQRTDGQPTRLLYDASMPKEVQKKIRKLLGLGKIDMMPGGNTTILKISCLFQIPPIIPNYISRNYLPCHIKISRKAPIILKP